MHYAKDNEIMFCLPPHSTHASQPLDMAVFNPLKGMMLYMHFCNPGKVVTKYNFPQYNFPPILKEAWEKTMTTANICSGFRSAGIYPFNREKVQPIVLTFQKRMKMKVSTVVTYYICKLHVTMYYE